MKRHILAFLFSGLVAGCVTDYTFAPVGSASDPVTDIDGNVYQTVQIGSQVWMAENLRTTRFNDGTAIPVVVDGKTWAALTTPGYCWYRNSQVTYGAYYNWYAASSAKLAPAGWHVPSESEWDALVNALGGQSAAGGRMKEPGTEYWREPNRISGNSCGFRAYGGGDRSVNGEFLGEKVFGYWWSSTGRAGDGANGIFLCTDHTGAYPVGSFKPYGYNVRCVKD